jgi:hypothetical protein
MAKWYEGAEEAAFKPVAGGYIFQPPSLRWPFVRSPCYLVNEAQKEKLIACLRRQRQQTFLVVMIFALAGTGLAMGLAMALAMAGPGLRISPVEFVVVLAATLLAVVPIAILPHIKLMRTIAPLLADLPRTNEQITFGDQLHTLAAAISIPLLVLGLIGGSLMIIGNIMSIVDAIAEGRGGSRPFWPLFGLLVGALLTSYFVYLAVLRRRLKRGAN